MVFIDPPEQNLKWLREALNVDEATEVENAEIFAYAASLASSLASVEDFDSTTWLETLSPYMAGISTSSDTSMDDLIEKYRTITEKATLSNMDDDSDEEDDFGGEELCNIRFSLAYGGKILLHQTKLRLRRGHRYALVGQNGAGKTTLMTAINNGKLDGWPFHLRTEYVDSGSNVDPVHEAKNVMGHLVNDTGKTEEECKKLLVEQLNFTDTMMNGTIGELSGGWQMKLRLAKAVLINADILLLDEPTNHLDHKTVRWLTEYLCALTDTTVICVSHDTPFMEEICTDVIHYEQRAVWGPHRRLVHYCGKMSKFVEKQPQAKHYFELATTDLKFIFPDPGRLEGIRTSTQKFLEMDGVDFKYPGAEKNTLNDVKLKMSLSSRIAVLGANGAGKTTLIKMIVGETMPSNMGQCKFFIHHNLRIAYVSQHAFYHVEQHLEDAPAKYIQWRFKHGYDKEKMQSEAYKISEEEQKIIDERSIEGIWSRRMRAGKLEYEIKKRNVPEKDNVYYSKEELLGFGLTNLIKQTDEKIAAKEAGLDLRPTTVSEIQKHLDDFGLAQEFGTYGKIRGLSGGQKVKLVLAAALWTCPHLLVLDEVSDSKF